MSAHKGTTRGFRHSAALLAPQMRKVSESRGFAVGRVLTHWAEIAGEEIAAIAHPVEVSYGRKGFGATLTVLTTGAQAPMLEMQKQTLRDKVNTVYGYNAISRIRVTQTAPTGFSEGQASFDHRPKSAAPPAPDPETQTRAHSLVAPIGDTGLRTALEALGRNVLSKTKR